MLNHDLIKGKVSILEFGKTSELFSYKEQGFKLPPFPGYDPDQWGIKAHNRPWVVSRMKFDKNIKIMEVGGAYSTLPKMLSDIYGVEAWIGDDFGESVNDTSLWTRWGNPRDLPIKNKPVNYIFEPMGVFSSNYPSNYFDYVFSVSTLEHIPMEKMPSVFLDMHRCLKIGGKQIHTIDISAEISLRQAFIARFFQKYPFMRKLWSGKDVNPVRSWIDVLIKAGFDLAVSEPNITGILSRETLVESPDVVFKYYPPMNKNKPYRPWATLLVEIDKTA